MATANLYSLAGEQTGSVDLPSGLFAAGVHSHALYESIKGYLANQRQGTHKTKNRHEVSGQKSKLYRQKGTGRARAGSATAGNRVGGGRIFGPRPRDYGTRVPAQVRRLALFSALSDRAAGAQVHVVEDLHLEAPRTRTVAALLGAMGLGGRKVLVVSAAAAGNLTKSCRNLPNVDVVTASQLHAYPVLRSEAVVIERSALARLEEVFGR